MLIRSTFHSRMRYLSSQNERTASELGQIQEKIPTGKEITKLSDNGTAINVNTFLWRATLDRLSFMPLESADRFGGVIITDWYTNSDTSKEKFKVVAYIIGKELRVDAIKVSVFKKIKDSNDEWVDKKTDNSLSTKIEDAILTSARKYKIENID